MAKTEEQLRALLVEITCDRGGQAKWADEHGFSRPYVNDLVKGRRRISAEVAQALGHTIVFRPVSETEEGAHA